MINNDLTDHNVFDKYAGRFGWVYDNGGGYLGEIWDWYFSSSNADAGNLLHQPNGKTAIVRFQDASTYTELWSGQILTTEDFDRAMKAVGCNQTAYYRPDDAAEVGDPFPDPVAPTKTKQQSQQIPFETCAMAGIALALSGQFPVLVLAAVAWFILRRVKPSAALQITLVSSIRIGAAFLACAAVVMGYAPIQTIVEVSVVSVVALLLFFTERREWAYILILHAAFVVYHRVINLFSEGSNANVNRIHLGVICVQGLIIWLLVSYLRKPKPRIEETGSAAAPDGEL